MKRVLGRIARFVVLPILALLLVTALGLLGYRAVVRSRLARERAIAPPGIASREMVDLGGVEQAVLLRGRDPRAPVVLFVHGGPGDTLMPLAGLLDPALEERYVVVHWDQRGTGASYATTPEGATLTMDRIVADCCELAERLRARFARPRIALVGHSFGSLVGALAAARRPDLFDAFVGVGQVVDCARTEARGLELALEAARAAGDARTERRLLALGPAPFAEHWKGDLVERTAFAQGGCVGRTPGIARVLLAAFTSPDYSLGDLYGALAGGLRSRDALWPDLRDLDLERAAPRIEVPCTFCLGARDRIAPPDVAERWIARLDAPRGKRVVRFEASAHCPFFEEPEAFVRALDAALAAR
ncbi:MAG TPA: alpha/beta hydrolase [Planctomycetota bacterium]|nr:alpha/beta hydrolase [Planctomycetota bacterium]